MTFREALARIVGETPGARAAAIVGSDGIAVEEFRREGDPIEPAAIGVELGAALEQARKAVAALEDGGPLEELVLCGGGLEVVARPLDEEYVLLVALERGALTGKARYLAASLLHRLREEL